MLRLPRDAEVLPVGCRVGAVLAPDAGDAWLSGLSLVREREAIKHRIAYMSQRFGLYADLTVDENLAFYADLYQVPSAERARTEYGVVLDAAGRVDEGETAWRRAAGR